MDLLARAATQWPDRDAVVGPDARWTYALLDATATDLAGRLAGAGVRPGSAVALAMPGSARAVALVHAVARAGAVLVPLDPRLPPAELGRRAHLAQVGLALAEGPAADALGRAGVRALAPDALQRGQPGPFERGAWEGLQGLVFTSGTSGRARAARLTFANQAASAAAVVQHLALTEQDRWLACVALFHVGGLAVVFRCALRGSAMLVEERFDAARVGQLLHGHATLASMVPVMLQRVLAEPDPRPLPAGLRAVLLGGDAPSADLLAACRARGLRALPSYGLTEASSTVCCAPLEGPPPPSGGSGPPLPGVEVRILDEEGQPVGGDDVGLIAVKGPVVCDGYHGDPEASAGMLRGGWLRTGDLGRRDKDGNLWVVGRLDDRIRTGSEGVDPAVVEAVLRSHPGIADACVVGVPDATWGQRVAAAIVRGPGATLVDGDLEAHCRARLAGFQVPRAWAFVAALPRNEAGKVARQQVRAMLAARPP